MEFSKHYNNKLPSHQDDLLHIMERGEFNVDNFGVNMDTYDSFTEEQQNKKKKKKNFNF